MDADGDDWCEDGVRRWWCERRVVMMVMMVMMVMVVMVLSVVVVKSAEALLRRWH